ncbi:MAG: glycosyltransferase [Nitrospiraceae bacterium]|nr:MAG: glycosyltransferase [Nitrospiraceae bacterium]
MEGVSIIIPVFNKVKTTLECIDFIREHNRNCTYEIIIVDNGSTDGTRDMLTHFTFIRNEKNLGVAKALNIGAGAARYDILCFMHNDVFVYRKDWPAEIYRFISTKEDSGVVGLYGAKTLRRDGSFRGKTIVHAKKGRPAINMPFENVAVVDGLLLSMKKPVYKAIGGFCEDFQVHFYDKDISLRAVEKGYDNYVLNIPFEHRCAATRSQIKDDDAIREAARKRFIEIWKDSLPADVTTVIEKIGYLFQKAES